MRGTFQRLFRNLNALVGVSQGMRAVRGARGGGANTDCPA